MQFFAHPHELVRKVDAFSLLIGRYPTIHTSGIFEDDHDETVFGRCRVVAIYNDGEKVVYEADGYEYISRTMNISGFVLS